MAGALAPVLGAPVPAPRRPARRAQIQHQEARRSPMKSAAPLQLTAPGEREIVMTRVLDAPRKLVFDAFTKPELLKQWLLGPPGWSMPVCEIDLRIGGRYRYVWRRDTDGTEMGCGGVYCEIVPPERLVHTEQ